MSHPDSTRASKLTKPVAGQTFRAATKLKVGGAKRRKLLCLIAAYADAGEPSPSVSVLSRWLGQTNYRTLGLLIRLEADGLLRVHWAVPPDLNVYKVVIEQTEQRSQDEGGHGPQR